MMRLRWNTLENASQPGIRSRHSMAWHSPLSGVLLFGGSNRRATLNDTWIFNGEHWLFINAGRPPASRDRAALAHDVKRGISVLFGGQNQSSRGWTQLADTWVLEDRKWRKRWKWPGLGPSARCGHSMAYDEASESVVLFGGASGIYVSLNDTWTFDGSRWKYVDTPAPPQRRYAEFVYDANLGGCVLYGGCMDDFGDYPLNDCWLFAQNRWHPLVPASGGPFRNDCGSVFFGRVGHAILLPGKAHEQGAMVLDGHAWRTEQVAGELHPRQCYGGAYDPIREAAVIYGGEDLDTGSRFSGTHLLADATEP
jgi:hypothetical protein